MRHGEGSKRMFGEPQLSFAPAAPCAFAAEAEPDEFTPMVKEPLPLAECGVGPPLPGSPPGRAGTLYGIGERAPSVISRLLGDGAVSGELSLHPARPGSSAGAGNDDEGAVAGGTKAYGTRWLRCPGWCGAIPLLPAVGAGAIPLNHGGGDISRAPTVGDSEDTEQPLGLSVCTEVGMDVGLPARAPPCRGGT